MSIIYLVRHGEITQTSPRRFVGQAELSLTSRGREQMAAVGHYLVEKGMTRLVCSSLSRCVESAVIVGAALGLVPEILPGLREISLGAWEGLSVDEVKERYPGRYEARGRNLAGFRPPGGESFADVQRRAWTEFESIAALAANGSSVVVIAHGGVNRSILCRILGMPLENLFRLGQDYACINVVSTKEDAYCLETLNLLV